MEPQRLNITPSYSRPQVSNDNAISESLFRTCKYRPDYPVDGYADLLAAQQWVADFVQWYNHEHRHSAIRFMTPTERHNGQDVAVSTSVKVDRIGGADGILDYIGGSSCIHMKIA